MHFAYWIPFLDLGSFTIGHPGVCLFGGLVWGCFKDFIITIEIIQEMRRIQGCALSSSAVEQGLHHGKMKECLPAPFRLY